MVATALLPSHPMAETVTFLSIVAKALKPATGDVRLMQFSASSPDVLAALLERAEEEMKGNPEKWRLISMADISSFLADWVSF